MFGNYSFQLNMLDADSGVRAKHYTFVEPVTLRLFVGLDNVVKSNNRVLQKVSPAIEPKLQLWDEANGTLYDALLTCPDPYSSYDFDTNILTVRICHFSQYMLYVDISKMQGSYALAFNNSDCNRTLTHPVNVSVVRRVGAVGSSLVTLLADCSGTAPAMQQSVLFSEGEWQKSVSFSLGENCLTPNISIVDVVNGTISMDWTGTCSFLAA